MATLKKKTNYDKHFINLQKAIADGLIVKKKKIILILRLHLSFLTQLYSTSRFIES